MASETDFVQKYIQEYIQENSQSEEIIIEREEEDFVEGIFKSKDVVTVLSEF